MSRSRVNWNHFVRQSHRWVSIVFTLGVIANMVAMATMEKGEEPAVWVGLLALFPLILLLLSGLYLFVLPYASKGRSAQSTG